MLKKSLLRLLIAATILVQSSLLLFAQTNGPINYFYDNLGRLIRVVDNSGNVAAYNYDAVGNITSITRSTIAANGLALTSFSPLQGIIGQTVILQGQGFSTTASANTVQFNGLAAVVSAATATSLTVTVPHGAQTGPVSVTVGTQTVTSSTNFTVLAPTPVSITIQPAGTMLVVAGGQRFSATATFNDGSQQDVTALATWGTSNSQVATADNSFGRSGIITGVGNGSASVTAVYSGLLGFAGVNVQTLNSLTLNPDSLTLPSGSTQQLTATANFSDGSSHDVTSQLIWSSDAPAIVTVSNSGSTLGLIDGISAGETVVCAVYQFHFSNCSDVTVVQGVPVSIAITPATLSVPKAINQTFTASGTFADGNSRDLTTIATWSSSDPTIATISNDPGTQGQTTDVGVGTTTISATVGTTSGSSTLTLTTPTAQQLTVNPARIVLQTGNTVQLGASETLTDNSTQDVTNSVTWTAADPTVATVNASGLLTAQGTGSTTITATSGTIKGTASLIVSTAKNVGLSRFGYVANGDATVSVYTVNATSGQFRANGYLQQSGGLSEAIALDPSNRFVYVASSQPNAISGYQIDPVNGSLITIPGSPFTAGNFPIAIAIDPSGKFLYAINSFADTISAFAIDPTTGALSEISGSPYVVGQRPLALTLDPSGQFLYVVNQSDNTISAFTVDPVAGTLNEISGSPFAAQQKPVTITADPKGRFLYVGNFGKSGGGSTTSAELLFGLKDKLSAEDSIGPLLASLDPNTLPESLGFGTKRVTSDSELPILASVRIAGKNVSQAQQVSGPSVSVFALDANGVPTEITESPFPVPNAPNSIVTDPSGTYVYELDGNQIVGLSVDPSSGALTQLPDSPYTTEFSSSALTMDASGQFLYAEGGLQDTEEFALNPTTGNLSLFGQFPNRAGIGVAVSKGTTPLSYVPQFAYVASSGETTSAGNGANNISGYSIGATGTLTALANSPFTEGFFPELVTSDPLGRFLYVTNNCSDTSCSAGSGSVSAYTIDMNAGLLSSVAGSPFAAGGDPNGVVVDPSGNFAYVANQRDNTIFGYSINQQVGLLTPLPGSPFTLPNRSTGPLTLAMDPEGLYLYAAVQCVVTPCNGSGVAVFIVNSSGELEPWFSTSAVASSVGSLAADPAGRFLVLADNSAGDIVVMGTSRTESFFSPVTGSPFPAGETPVSVTVDPTSRFVYAVDQNSNDIFAYSLDPSSGTLTPVSGSPFPAGLGPVSVTIDISGTYLYAVNNGGNSVAVFSIDPGSGILTPVGSPVPVGTAPVSITTTGKIQ